MVVATARKARLELQGIADIGSGVRHCTSKLYGFNASARWPGRRRDHNTCFGCARADYPHATSVRQPGLPRSSSRGAIQNLEFFFEDFRSECAAPSLSTIFVCFLASSLAVAQAQQESTRKLTSSRPPAYPALARGMNLEGNVKVRVTVSPGGYGEVQRSAGRECRVLQSRAQDAVLRGNGRRPRRKPRLS